MTLPDTLSIVEARQYLTQLADYVVVEECGALSCQELIPHLHIPRPILFPRVLEVGSIAAELFWLLGDSPMDLASRVLTRNCVVVLMSKSVLTEFEIAFRNVGN